MVLKVAILWILFFVLHSLLADDSIKEFVKQKTGKLFNLYRLVYNLISIAIFLAVVAALKDIDHNKIIFNFPWMVNFGGWFLILFGSVILLMALYSYNLLDFAGLSQVSGKEEKHDKLITTGLNGIVRHPIYFAIILISGGACLILPSDLVFLSATLSLVYLFIGTWLEERKLIKIYGQAYKDYQKRVKMFIPFVL